MNVYEFDIWKQVKRDGEFSHTCTRMELIHALNEERATSKITLAGEKTWESGGGKFVVSGEFIYAVRKTLTVVKQMYYVYSDGRGPRPVRYL